MLAAFGLSALAIPGVALQLAGVLPGAIPLWYGLFGMFVAAVEVVIATWMFRLYRLYRRYGVWAAGA